MERQSASCYFTKGAPSGFSPLREAAVEWVSHLRLVACRLTTHGSKPPSRAWVKGMGRRVCICYPGIAAHTPVGRRGACSGGHFWWSSVSQPVLISKTGLSEGFGELGLTAKALMPQFGKRKMAVLPGIQVGSGSTRKESTDADLGKGRGTDLIIHRRPRRKRTGN